MRVSPTDYWLLITHSFSQRMMQPTDSNYGRVMVQPLAQWWSKISILVLTVVGPEAWQLLAILSFSQLMTEFTDKNCGRVMEQQPVQQSSKISIQAVATVFSISSQTWVTISISWFPIMEAAVWNYGKVTEQKLVRWWLRTSAEVTAVVPHS